MTENLVTGPPTLLVAIALELTNRGYVQSGDSIDKSGSDNVFIHIEHDKKSFTESLVRVSGITGMLETDPTYFILPTDWAELIDELNDVCSKKEQQLQDISDDNGGINPFDPAGIVKKMDSETLAFLLACPVCGGYHSRHAGYFTTKSAYKNADERAGSTFTTNIPVHICVNCKTPIASIGGVVYDVSKHVDVKAWEKTEKQAYKTTGPGGQC